MKSKDAVDPGWEEISASLRNGVLYVKMPVIKARVLVEALQACEGDLGHKEVSPVGSSGISLIMSGPAEEWQKDVDNAHLVDGSPGIFKEFTAALICGLAGGPQVDWIIRTAPPPPAASP